MNNLTILLIGIGIGLISALIGALVDYLIGRRRRERKTNGPPGCLMIVAGALGLTGIVVTVLSIVWFIRSY